jgi:ACS family hexuronate transporter-like MFS transporter
VPILFVWKGWQAAFIATGLAGLLWVLFWWPIYRRPREHKKLSPAELAYIESDPPDPPIKIRWLDLLPFRQTQAFAFGKFMTDAVWWFYLFWFAKFMSERFGVNIKAIGLPMITVYVLADIGSIAGGWQSSWLLKRGWSANVARKTAMLTCALCVVPVAAAPLVQGDYYIGGWLIEAKWIAVLLIGVAAAAHQGFSANMFTLASDMFPRGAVGSVVGIGGFAGAMGGVLMNLAAGRLRDLTGNYIVMFSVAASVYLLALLVIHLLVPQLQPVELGMSDPKV